VKRKPAEPILAGPCGDNFQGMVTNFVNTPSPIQGEWTSQD